MKNTTLIFTLLVQVSTAMSQQNIVDKEKVQEDLNEMIANLSNNYVYLADKEISMNCIKQEYSKKITQLETQNDVVLLFEYLLDEFYDNHISLSTNIRESYRLSSPIYVENESNKFIVKNVWNTQIEKLDHNIIGAEILKFNSIDFMQKLSNFPTVCQNKKLTEIINWTANKVISGKYSEPRVLQLKLNSGNIIDFDLDTVEIINDSKLLSSKTINDIGIIRINNSLGNNLLIEEFDQALNELIETKGLIIDLRNTNNGGNSYVAKGIMSRFISKELPYQKHQFIESYDNQPKIIRSWLELVSPRGQQYTKPLIVLVGRWTGSMGEGIAVGFDGMERAEIIGTEMKRLAGSDFDFRFKNQNYGYKVILQKLFHINGTPREKYLPSYYIKQTTNIKDQTLQQAMKRMAKILESYNTKQKITVKQIIIR